MKKSKLLIVGLIGLLLAVGLVLASCGKNCATNKNSDGSCAGFDYCEKGFGCASYDRNEDGSYSNNGKKCDC